MSSYKGTTICSGKSTVQLLEEVGRGGYGVVMRGQDLAAPQSKSRVCAVKILSKAESGTSRHRYHVREMNHHMAVGSHPNIVTARSIIQDDHSIFLVLDFCPGGTLLEFIREERPFARNDAFLKGIFTQLVDAVHFIHEKGIYHRDIKPENILLNRERNKVFLSDFGLSTKEPETRDFGLGSKHYMSPESLSRSADCYSSKRSDLWALGIVLVNMITGRVPWGYATFQDQAYVDFMRQRNFLRRCFPMSRAAQSVVRQVLTPNPSMSVGLVELRRLVEEVDTFFMTDEELSHARQASRNVAADYFRTEGRTKRELYMIPDTTSDDLSSFTTPDSSEPAPTGSPPNQKGDSGDETPSSSDTSFSRRATASNSSWDVKSIFRLPRAQDVDIRSKSCPEASSRPIIARLSLQLRKVFNGL